MNNKEIANYLYRFAHLQSQVNWEARYMATTSPGLVSELCDFLDSNIRRVSVNFKDLRVIVGVSGIDSAVTATLSAETMRRAKQTQTVNNTYLEIVNFRASNREDEKYGADYVKWVKSAYPELDIHFYRSDLTPVIKKFDRFVNEINKSTNNPLVWPSEPITGLIDLATVNMGYQIGAAAPDSTNKTEIVLGEINNPAGCTIHVLEHLWKSQVYDLAEVLEIPSSLTNRKPINSTYGVSKIDSYFGEIPDEITPRQIYKVLDLVLKSLYEDKQSPVEVAQQLGHSLDFVQKVQDKILSQNHRRNIPTFIP